MPRKKPYYRKLKISEPAKPAKEPLRISLSENARKAIAMNILRFGPDEDTMRALLVCFGVPYHQITPQILAQAMGAAALSRETIHQIARTAQHACIGSEGLR